MESEMGLANEQQALQFYEEQIRFAKIGIAQIEEIFLHLTEFLDKREKWEDPALSDADRLFLQERLAEV